MLRVETYENPTDIPAKLKQHLSVAFVSIACFSVLILGLIFIQPAYTLNLGETRGEIEHEYGVYIISNSLVKFQSEEWTHENLTSEGIARAIQSHISNSRLEDNTIVVPYNNIIISCFGNGMNEDHFYGYVIIDINGVNLPNSENGDEPDQFKHNLVLKDGNMSIQ